MIGSQGELAGLRQREVESQDDELGTAVFSGAFGVLVGLQPATQLPAPLKWADR